jgi:hypothetical protein
MTKTITVRVSEEDARIFEKYAKTHGMPVSRALRETMIERIEDEYDYELLRKELANAKNKRTYTTAEIKASLGII